MSESKFKLPERVSDLATACGFQVNGWDDESDDAIVKGPDVEYLGTKAECIAYMTAWQQCQSLKLRAELAEDYDPRQAKVRVGLIGLWARDIQPGATSTVVSRPQSTAFRGSRVIIPDNLAPHFEIYDIRVGNHSQFLQSCTLPGEAFAARLPNSLATYLEEIRDNRIVGLSMTKSALAEFGRSMSFEACQVSQDLVFMVGNISKEPQTFRAWVVGKYAGY